MLFGCPEISVVSTIAMRPLGGASNRKASGFAGGSLLYSGQYRAPAKPESALRFEPPLPRLASGVASRLQPPRQRFEVLSRPYLTVDRCAWLALY